MEDERGRAAARAWRPGRPPPSPTPSPSPSPPRPPALAVSSSSVAVAACSPPAARAICPSKCACDDEVSRATCESAGLEVVPIQLNPEVRSISLRGNRIVSSHMSFTFYMNSRWSDVSRNRVASSGARVFEFQEKLVHLNISGNEVSSSSKDAFRGSRSLRVSDSSENSSEASPAAASGDTPDSAESYSASNRSSNVADRAFDGSMYSRVSRLDDNQSLEVPAGASRKSPASKSSGLSDNSSEASGEEASPPMRDSRALHSRGNVIMEVHRAAFDGLPASQMSDSSDNNSTWVPTAALAKSAHSAESDSSGNASAASEPVAFQSSFESRRSRSSRSPRSRRVDARALADNVDSESVALDDTGLDASPARLFHDRRALVHISVRGNGFTSSDASQFPSDQSRSLASGDNPSHCNCSSSWSWSSTRRQLEAEARNATAAEAAAAGGGGGDAGGGVAAATPHLDVDAIRCAEPEPSRNKSVADAPEAAVRCDASWLSVIIVAIVVSASFAGTCGSSSSVGTGRWCRRPGEDEAEASAASPAAAAAHGHSQNGAVLMSVTSKESADPMEGVVSRAKEHHPPPVTFSHHPHHRFPPDAWDPPCKETPADPAANAHALANADPPPYHLNGAAPRKPHIVYV